MTVQLEIKKPEPDQFSVSYALGAVASEIQADFQYCHCWTRNLGIDNSSRSCTNTLFLPPRGRNRAYFSPDEQWFLRYWLIFKIAIFGPETWPLSKVLEVAHILSCTSPIFLTTYHSGAFRKTFLVSNSGTVFPAVYQTHFEKVHRITPK